MTDIEVTIKALGAKGDGVAETKEGVVFVPFTAPGDNVKVKLGKSKDGVRRGKILSLIKAGRDRVPAPCEHFTECGGCSAQHISPVAYQDWKREIVCQALERQNLDRSLVGDLVAGTTGERRRARFSSRRLTNGTILGFLETASHRIVDMNDCPILHADIAALVPSLRSLLD